jgi:hypothetical protein
MRLARVSALYRPCLNLPLRSPAGAPDPLAPPCSRQRFLPSLGISRQFPPPRVYAMRAAGSSAATRPIGNVTPAAVKPSARIRKLRRGVINVSSVDISPCAHAPLLPVLRTDLLVQTVMVTDAGLGGV